MTDEARKEIFSRMDAIIIDPEELMTYEQLNYFMEGYSYCRSQMLDIVDDTYRHLRDKKATLENELGVKEHDGE